MKKLVVITFLFFLSTLIVCQETEQVDMFQKAVENSVNSDPYIRRQAAEQFGMLRDPRGIPYLKKMLEDENPFVRQAAVDSLGLLRDRDSVQDIIKILLTDKEPQVRQSAAVALGYIGDMSAVGPLTKVLSSTDTPQAVRYAACNTLGVLRSTESIPVLISLLSEEDMNLRRSVVHTLRRIPHPDGISALRSLLEQEKDENIIVDVIVGLVEFNDKDSIERFKILYSTHTSKKVKFYSAAGLAKLAGDKTVLPVIKSSLKDTDERIKITAIEAAGFVGDRETLNILKSMLSQEQNPYIKEVLKISISRLETKLPKPVPVSKPKK